MKKRAVLAMILSLALLLGAAPAYAVGGGRMGGPATEQGGFDVLPPQEPEEPAGPDETKDSEVLEEPEDAQDEQPEQPEDMELPEEPDEKEPTPGEESTQQSTRAAAAATLSRASLLGLLNSGTASDAGETYVLNEDIRILSSELSMTDFTSFVLRSGIEGNGKTITVEVDDAQPRPLFFNLDGAKVENLTVVYEGGAYGTAFAANHVENSHLSGLTVKVEGDVRAALSYDSISEVFASVLAARVASSTLNNVRVEAGAIGYWDGVDTTASKGQGAYAVARELVLCEIDGLVVRVQTLEARHARHAQAAGVASRVLCNYDGGGNINRQAKNLDVEIGSIQAFVNDPTGSSVADEASGAFGYAHSADHLADSRFSIGTLAAKSVNLNSYIRVTIISGNEYGLDTPIFLQGNEFTVGSVKAESDSGYVVAGLYGLLNTGSFTTNNNTIHITGNVEMLDLGGGRATNPRCIFVGFLQGTNDYLAYTSTSDSLRVDGSITIQGRDSAYASLFAITVGSVVRGSVEVGGDILVSAQGELYASGFAMQSPGLQNCSTRVKGSLQAVAENAQLLLAGFTLLALPGMEIQATDCSVQVGALAADAKGHNAIVGGFAAFPTVPHTLEGCTVDIGSVTSDAKAAAFAAGVVGYTTAPVVAEQFAVKVGSIVALGGGFSYAGGFLGSAKGESIRFQECQVEVGSIAAEKAQYAYAAGFVANTEASVVTALYDACSVWVTEDISVSSPEEALCAGFTPYVDAGHTVQNSFVQVGGTLRMAGAQTSAFAAGLAGFVEGKITGCAVFLNEAPAAQNCQAPYMAYLYSTLSAGASFSQNTLLAHPSTDAHLIAGADAPGSAGAFAQNFLTTVYGGQRISHQLEYDDVQDAFVLASMPSNGYLRLAQSGANVTVSARESDPLYTLTPLGGVAPVAGGSYTQGEGQHTLLYAEVGGARVAKDMAGLPTWADGERLTGRLLADNSGNGVYDVPLAGVEIGVYSYGDVWHSTTTGVDGGYVLDLPLVSVTSEVALPIHIVLPEGYTLSTHTPLPFEAGRPTVQTVVYQAENSNDIYVRATGKNPGLPPSLGPSSGGSSSPGSSAAPSQGPSFGSSDFSSAAPAPGGQQNQPNVRTGDTAAPAWLAILALAALAAAGLLGILVWRRKKEGR